jgi:hypothetical protein
VGEIRELVERKLGLQVAASPPKRKLAIRTGIDESKLERAVRPAIERGIVRACRNRRPKIGEPALMALDGADVGRPAYPGRSAARSVLRC